MNYYDQKFREHVEMMDAYCFFIKWLFIGAGVIALWRQLFGG